MIHAFTCAAPNYIGKVRALCESLRRHCPGMVLHWAVADDVHHALRDGLSREPFDDVLFATELDGFASRSLLFRFTLVELSTAIKPAAALHLLSLPDCDGLLYFDPDVVVFSPLDDLLGELAGASLLLTPHLLEPETNDEAARDNEVAALRHGVFNMGFFGLRKCPEALRFLEWWRSRVMISCTEDVFSGAFTDQKWINLAPVFFQGTKILRDPRFNVAPWNLSRRAVSGSLVNGFCVNGSTPLGFYHFSGFDDGAHDRMMRKYASGNQGLEELAAWYRKRTAELLGAEVVEWKLGCYSNGRTIEKAERREYACSGDSQEKRPDPYNAAFDGPCLPGDSAAGAEEPDRM